MRIHLFCSPEESDFTLKEVKAILDKAGPAFRVHIAGESLSLGFDSHILSHKFNYPSKKATLDLLENRPAPKSWREMFDTCNGYRRRNDLPKSDMVVLLTKRKNALNWFSAQDGHGNAFVCTDEWELFADQDPRFAIAFQVIEQVVAFLMGIPSTAESMVYRHQPVKGCINDFCSDKRQVLIKLQTGNICPECLEKLNLSCTPAEINALKRILAAIRDAFFFHVKDEYQQPLLLELRIDRSFYIDGVSLKFGFGPKESTLYAFLLSQPDGIASNSLIDHLAKLNRWYRFFRASNKSLEALALEPLTNNGPVEKLTNATETDFSISKSRINAHLKKILPHALLDHYLIQGGKTRPHQIFLPQHLIRLPAI